MLGRALAAQKQADRIEFCSRSTLLRYVDQEPADRMDSKSSSPHSARVATLARMIRARRKVLRLTQVDLSRLAGCGPDFVYDLEAGKTTLRFDKLLDVLGVLGLELVVGEGKGILVMAPNIALRAMR